MLRWQSSALKPRRVLAFVGVLITVGVASRGAADDLPSLSLEPAPAYDRSFVARRASVRGDWLACGRLVIDYAHAPLVLERESGEKDDVVGHYAVAHALGSLTIAHRFAFELDLPLSWSGTVNAAALAGPHDPGGAGLGDMRLGARIALYRSEEEAAVRHAVAFDSTLWLPTATTEFAGDGVPRVGIGIGAESVGPRLFGSLHAGAHSRAVARLMSNLDELGNPRKDISEPGVGPIARVGLSLVAAAGAGFFPDKARRFELGAEAVTTMVMGGGALPFDPRASTAHGFLTGRHRLGGGPLELAVALGAGLANGPGNADLRALGSVGFAPDQAPPPKDRDHDGVPDRSDACADLAGEPSRDAVLNGCPTMQDLDGDAIADDHDACPREPGRHTFIRQSHGCPELTLREREAAVQGTRLERGAIVISQRIDFEVRTSVLRAESAVVLEEVMAVLAAHPELALLEVAGHTDESGSDELNLRLSGERAASVIAWLVQRGVSPVRLVGKGYGDAQPIADNETEEGRTKNRRVEFRVLRSTIAPNPEGAPREDDP
ncbi:MAG: OmpA family protein [Myxococcales bacterium]|nr:OmpA family protein [Myxococcales bacterium]